MQTELTFILFMLLICSIDYEAFNNLKNLVKVNK
jgi:hypothetical protein